MFFGAGSDRVLTNSFGGEALRLKLHEAQDCIVELNAGADCLARTSADAATDRQERRLTVAGLMGPTGELVEPMGALTHETTRDVLPNRRTLLQMVA